MNNSRSLSRDESAVVPLYRRTWRRTHFALLFGSARSRIDRYWNRQRKFLLLSFLLTGPLIRRRRFWRVRPWPRSCTRWTWTSNCCTVRRTASTANFSFRRRTKPNIRKTRRPTMSMSSFPTVKNTNGFISSALAIDSDGTDVSRFARRAQNIVATLLSRFPIPRPVWPQSVHQASRQFPQENSAGQCSSRLQSHRHPPNGNGDGSSNY